MINEFFNTVQNDVALVFNTFVGKQPASEKRNEKVGLAALRLIATVGMALSGLMVLTAAPYIAAAPVGALLKMALATGLYVLSHDEFVWAKNKTDQLIDDPKKAAEDWLKRNAKPNASLPVIDDIDSAAKAFLAEHPLPAVTENTILRCIWDKV